MNEGRGEGAADNESGKDSSGGFLSGAERSNDDRAVEALGSRGLNVNAASSVMAGDDPSWGDRFADFFGMGAPGGFSNSNAAMGLAGLLGAMLGGPLGGLVAGSAVGMAQGRSPGGIIGGGIGGLLGGVGGSVMGPAGSVLGGWTGSNLGANMGRGIDRGVQMAQNDGGLVGADSGSHVGKSRGSYADGGEVEASSPRRYAAPEWAQQVWDSLTPEQQIGLKDRQGYSGGLDAGFNAYVASSPTNVANFERDLQWLRDGSLKADVLRPGMPDHYEASNAIQQAWDGMTTQQQQQIGQQLGYTGNIKDDAFNRHVMGNGLASKFEALVQGTKPPVTVPDNPMVKPDLYRPIQAPEVVGYQPSRYTQDQKNQYQQGFLNIPTAMASAPKSAGDSYQIPQYKAHIPLDQQQLQAYLASLGINWRADGERNYFPGRKYLLPETVAPSTPTTTDNPDNPNPQVQNARNGGIMDLRRGGPSDGPGDGQSDSIPAKLSDGEFVFTKQAVMGLGGGDRKKGAKKLYQMMHQAERHASGMGIGKR